jgi:hypothetical protein
MKFVSPATHAHQRIAQWDAAEPRAPAIVPDCEVIVNVDACRLVEVLRTTNARSEFFAS